MLSIVTYTLTVFILFNHLPVFSEEPVTDPFISYMLEWRDNIDKAQNYLRESTDEYKSGKAYQGCLKQRIASKFGVKAFEFLIKAQQMNDPDKDLENTQANLDRWKNLSKCTAYANFP